MGLRRELLVAAGILLDQQGRVLLVGNDWSRRGRVRYTLPGGMVEPGEATHQAVVREVYEETGLVIRRHLHMAYVVQIEDLRRHERTLAIAFHVEWEGLLNPGDPDGHVVEARFFAPDEVCVRMETRKPLCEPLLQYLQGAAPGRFYAYKGWSEAGEIV